MVRKVSLKKSYSVINDQSNDSDKVVVVENSIGFKKRELKKLKLEEKTVPVKSQVFDKEIVGSMGELNGKSSPIIALPEPAILFSPRPVSELDAAAVKLQKVYKSYRTRRNLADCAVVVEELWWKALDFAALKRSSVSFFEKPETAVSRWARAGTRAAKVGKGLSKDEKAQKLALTHWLEAIDPRHRYGHNLHLYYDVWFNSESAQPFFYWLDIGDGKEVNLEKCPRTNLQRECIKYLGPNERETYEAIIENGKLVYKQSRLLVDSVEGTKWIYVLSTSRKLYVAEKKKGHFHHSSFLAGGATTAAGRLIVRDGVLEALWAYSGHYRPTEENFKELITFLEDQNVDLTNVKTCPMDDDIPPPKVTEDATPESLVNIPTKTLSENKKVESTKPAKDTEAAVGKNHEVNNLKINEEGSSAFEFGKCLMGKWSTGAGPRIGCVRDYPTELQFKALEQVNLSPKPMNRGALPGCNPIPSPRPCPKVHLSPRLACMGLPSPRALVPTPN